jgi:hypothetical protein
MLNDAQTQRLSRHYICDSCGTVTSTPQQSPACCDHTMRILSLDRYARVCHWSKKRRLQWLANGGPDRKPDDPRMVAASFLRRCSCPDCNNPFDWVQINDFSRGHTPKFRCTPPHPTCWQVRCVQCNAWVNLAVRFDKVWPVAGSVEPYVNQKRR